MSLRLGLDFGTATTCVATVPDLTSFRPEVVPLDGSDPFQNSAVFLTQAGEGEAIVPSSSDTKRVPVALFGHAQERFEEYWRRRVRAQAQGVAWASWCAEGRGEATLLLTYFKPELADHPVRRPVRVPKVRFGRYDPMSQSDELEFDWEEREAATPEPDTHDLVAATAAIVRKAVERSVTHYRQRVSMLAIGLPSFTGVLDAAEAERAKARRLAAVAASGIAADFGTSDFHVAFLGEAQAAAFALDAAPDVKEACAVVVDVGAGTTDLALVPFRRERAGGRLLAGEPLATATDRFAGRDLNLALAIALKQNRDFRMATDLLDEIDRRAWQRIMDDEVESIKCRLTSDKKYFQISFARHAAYIEGCGVYEERARLLRRGPDWFLSSDDESLKRVMRSACKPWRDRVGQFLERAQAEVRGRNGELTSVELVGGAFRFAPLRRVLDSAVKRAGLHDVPVHFRDGGGSAQTAVARGLARWAAMQ